MLAINNPDVFLESHSIYMKPSVSAEWNYNFFKSPYITIAGDGSLQTLETPTGNTVSSSTIVKGNFEVKQFTATGGTGTITYPVTLTAGSKAYKVITFVKTNSQYPSTINTRISNSTSFQYGSSSVQADSLGWTKIETYVGADDIISTFSYTMTASLNILSGSTYPDFNVYYTVPEVYAVTQFDYQYGSMFSSDSPFKYFRPGESYIKTGNADIAFPDNYRKANSKTGTPYMPISPILYNPNFAINKIPASSIMKNGLPTNAMPYQYFVSDITNKILTAKYESDLMVNKIVFKFNTTITKPSLVTIKINNTTLTPTTPFIPDEKGILVLYWDGTSWSSTEKWTLQTPIPGGKVSMPSFNSDGSLSMYTIINSISVQTTEELQTLFTDSVYSSIATNANRMQIIEISPRLELDISGFVENINIRKSLDSNDSSMPISSLNANDASFTLSGMPVLSTSNELVQIFSNESNVSSTILNGMLMKNVKLYVNFNTMSTFEADSDSQSYPDYNQYIPGGIYYADSWTESDINSITIQSYDVTRYLQSLSVPDYVASLKPIFDVITNILDLAGFTDYDYDSLYDVCNDLVSTMDVSYYFCSSQDKTVVAALSELFLAYQIGAYIDEYGIMKFLSLAKILNPDTTNPLVNTSIISIDDFNIESDGYEFASKSKPGKISLSYSPPKIKQSPSLQNIKNIDIKNSPSFVMTTSNDVVWTQGNLDSLGFNYLNQSMSATDSYFKLDVNDLLNIFHTYSFNTAGYGVIEDEIVSFVNKEYNIFKASNPSTLKKVSVKNEIELSSQINKFTKENSIDFIKSETRTSASPVTIGAGSKTFAISNTNGFYKYGRVYIYATADKTKFMYGYITATTTNTDITVRVDNFNGSGSLSAWTISNIPDYDIYIEPTGNITNIERGAFNTRISAHTVLDDSGSISNKSLSEATVSSIYGITSPSTTTTITNNNILATVPLNSKVIIYPTTQRDQGYCTYSSKFEFTGTKMSVGGVFFNMPVDGGGNITSSAEGSYFVEIVRYTYATTFDQNTQYSYLMFVYYVDPSDIYSSNKELLLGYTNIDKAIQYVLDNIPQEFKLNETGSTNKYDVLYDDIFNLKVTYQAEDISQGNVSVNGDKTLNIFINNQLITGWQVPGRSSGIVRYTSSSSVTIGVGTKTFDVSGSVKYFDPAGAGYDSTKPEYIYLVSSTNPDNYIFGSITAITTTGSPVTSSTITMLVNEIHGSGTASSWKIYDGWEPIAINTVNGLRKKLVLPASPVTGRIFGSYSANKAMRMISYILPTSPTVPVGVVEKIYSLSEIYATQTALNNASTSYYYQHRKFLDATLLGQRDIEKTYCMQTKPEVVGFNYYSVEYQNPAAIDVNITATEYLWTYIPTVDPKDQRYKQSLIVNDYNVSSSTILNTGFKGKFILVNNAPHLIFTSKEADDLNQFTTKLNVWTHSIIAPSDKQIIEKIIDPFNTSEVINLSSEWIQSDTAAYQILSVIASGAEGFSKEISLDIFGNPLIQVGDVINLTYNLKNMFNQKYLVRGVTQSFDQGLSTNLSLISLMNSEITLPEQVTLSYSANNNTSGTIPTSTTISEGSSVSVSSYGSLAKDGYTFVEWNTQADGNGLSFNSNESIVLNQNTILYAQWTPVINIVTFDGNGSTSGSMLQQYSSVPIQLNLNSFRRTGYEFTGWNTMANGTGTSYIDGATYSFTTTIILYAQWIIPSHTVKFNGNDATSGTMLDQTTNVSTALTSNGFIRTGYTFANWNTAPNGSGTAYADTASYDFAADITLYAQWAAILSHTVTFNGNGSDGGTTPSQTENTPTALVTNGFTRTGGYIFNNWNTAPDGSGTIYNQNDIYSFASDITLYAQWDLVGAHFVNFEGNGATGGSTSPQIANTPTALTANGFVNNGYLFIGWNTSYDGSGTSYTDQEVYSFASNITLYAQWEMSPNAHFVDFYGNGAEQGYSYGQIGHFSAALQNNMYTRPGYTFIEWNTAIDGSGTAYANGAIYDFAADLSLYAQWQLI